MSGGRGGAATIAVPARFRGPADSGNGGYTCGLVAGLIEGDAEVTLRAPPPLDRSMRVEQLEGGGVVVLDGDHLIAEGRPIAWDPQAPEPPTFEAAADAARRYPGLERHAFPQCFVCGTDRPDGLRIFPGPVPGRDLVASPWMPDPSLPNVDGVLTGEILWSALDCPGAWAEERHLEDAPVVLGRMAAHLVAEVSVGDRCIAVGWPAGREGRKLYSGTALFAAGGGELLGVARQTWIVLSS